MGDVLTTVYIYIYVYSQVLKCVQLYPPSCFLFSLSLSLCFYYHHIVPRQTLVITHDCTVCVCVCVVAVESARATSKLVHFVYVSLSIFHD